MILQPADSSRQNVPELKVGLSVFPLHLALFGSAYCWVYDVIVGSHFLLRSFCPGLLAKGGIHVCVHSVFGPSRAVLVNCM